MTHIYDTILIIGGGLIGSSLARAARTFDAAETILIADASVAACKQIRALNIADDVATKATSFAAKADLIVLAVPPGKMGAVAETVIPVMKSGATLTDVASIKGDVVKAITPFVRKDIAFVPGHPIAGTENSGPAAGFSDLFKDRWCVLTPENGRDKAVIPLKKFWTALGSQVAIMSPARHDIVLATTSHVPHLIAYTLVGTAVDMETVTRNEVVKFSAGGFRDFTRIAASDPEMWRDVFLQNREAVLEVVDRFIEDLSALKRAIRWEDADTLMTHFAKTRDIRRRIIDAGQDSPTPNFGRDEAE
ncbi:MAG: prephenate/arogenate dehydrogenase family protein [Alphaproteobacteria bacterium]